jgi:hypothetical protein
MQSYLARFGFQKDLEKSRMMAYISNLPAIIKTAENSLLKLDRILKFPPIMSPKAVPLLVMQARVVQKVVSISKFSKEKTREPNRNTRKYSIRNTVMEDTLAALIGLP